MEFSELDRHPTMPEGRVSPGSTAICILSEKGEIAREMQVAGETETLVTFMRDLPHGIDDIGLESRSCVSSRDVFAESASAPRSQNRIVAMSQ